MLLQMPHVFMLDQNGASNLTGKHPFPRDFDDTAFLISRMHTALIH